MRMHATRWAPDDRNSPGQGGGEEPFAPPQESLRAGRGKTEAPPDPTPTEAPSDTATRGQRVSGPGPNDLTRGLP